VAGFGQRFAIRYGAFRLLLSILGLGPAFSSVTVEPDTLRVAMGWAFRARIARSSVRRAEEGPDAAASIGVHGFGGRWLVNGALSGIVVVELDPPARAIVMGFPVKVRELRVGVEDPAGLLTALRS